MMQVISEMAPHLGVAPTCTALGFPHASYYRGHQLRLEPKPRPAPVRALPPEERAQVLAALREPRFVDLALAEAFAKNPERFPKGLPQPKAVPTAVWINPPGSGAGASADESTLTRQTREVAIADPGASCEADLEVDRRWDDQSVKMPTTSQTRSQCQG